MIPSDKGADISRDIGKDFCLLYRLICLGNKQEDRILEKYLKLHFLIYKLSIQIQISLILGNLYSAELHTDISPEQEKKYVIKCDIIIIIV